ncbi:hypothetical protein SRABI112_03797 [Pseudomonas mediterranea]|nr:hypothetical protein SRABI112_03797 [Pseudomonas mediterranea]
MKQRTEDFPDREIEGVGVEQRPDILGIELEVRAIVMQQPHDVAVFEQCTLGFTGGTRGVDHIAEVFRGVDVGRVGDTGVDVAEGRIEDFDTQRLQRRRHALARDGLARATVAQHVGDALLGRSRVDGHISAAGLEHRQGGDDHLHRALQRDGHQFLGPHTCGAQTVSEAVGLFVELAIAQLFLAEVDGNAFRCPAGLLLENLLQGQGVGPGRFTVVEVDDLPLPFGVVQQGNVVDPLQGIFDKGFQQAHVVTHQLLDEPGVEELRVVHHMPGPALFASTDQQVQVVLAVAQVAFQGIDRQPRDQRAGVGVALEVEQYVEQRGAAHVLGRIQRQHQLVELHVPMAQGLGQVVAGLFPELLQGGVAVAETAHHQEVVQRPDHVVQAGLAAGGRGADHQFVVAGIAAQQRGKGAEGQAVAAHADFPGQGFEAADQRRFEAEGMGRFGKHMHGHARPIERQLQGLQLAAQLVAPVGPQVLQHRGRKLALPGGKVAIAQRQGRQLGVAFGAGGFIEGQQVTLEQLHRGAVGQQMMHGNRQHGVAFVRLHQAGAHQAAAVHGQRPTRLGQGLGREVDRIALNPFKGQGCRSVEALPGTRTVALDPATQDVVTSQQAVEGGLQGRLVDLAGQLQQQGDVVIDRVGVVQVTVLEGVDEPEPFLVIGQRHALRHRRQRGDGRQDQGRVQFQCTDTGVRCFGETVQQAFEARREAFDGGGIEQRGGIRQAA